MVMYVQMSFPFELLETEQPDAPDELEEYQPGRCPHEVQSVDMGDNGNIKTECDLTHKALGHNMWTNCHVWGSCTLRGEI